MENSRKELITVQETSNSPNQSTTRADTVIISSMNPNLEVEKLADESYSLRLLDDQREINAVDEHLRHHESLDVERLEDSLSSKLLLYNSNEDNFNEDCLLEIFSYLSIDDMIQVKGVCKKWYLVSQQWFKRVQTLEYDDDDMGNGTVKLYEKYYNRKIYEGFETKKFMSILNSCGHHIKYFKTEMEEMDPPFEEHKKFILQWCPKLCENIVNADIFVPDHFYSQSTFEIMAKHWKKLENLDIKWFCPPVEENFLELLRNNQKLKSFSLHFNSNYDSRIDDKILSCLPTTINKIGLIFMTIEGTEQLSHFRSVSKNFTSLQSLNLSCFNYLTDAVVVAIANIKSLTHLSLPKVHRYESRKSIESIANLKGLKSLDLSDNSDLLEDSLINIVESCIQLEHLDINFWELLTDKGMASIAKLERLKILHIYGKNVSIKSILNLPDSLEIFGCCHSKMSDTDVIKFLKKAINLRFADFSMDNDLTEDVLVAAYEISNERKNNILCITGDFGPVVIFYIDTPYFKYCVDTENIPLEIFPEHIRNYLKECYCL